eukprot:g679.t1
MFRPRVGDEVITHKSQWGNVAMSRSALWSEFRMGGDKICIQVDKSRADVSCATATKTEKELLDCEVAAATWPALRVAIQDGVWVRQILRVPLAASASTAARDLCTALVTRANWRCISPGVPSNNDDYAFSCDWAARRAITEWRFDHICEEDEWRAHLGAVDTPPWVRRSLKRGHVRKRRDDSVLDFAAEICASVLQNAKGRSIVAAGVASSSSGDDESDNSDRLLRTCTNVVSAAVHAAMESAVTKRTGRSDAPFLIGPSPAFRVRDGLKNRAEEMLGAWSNADIEILSAIRANVARFVHVAVKKYCVVSSDSERRRARVLEVGAQVYSLLKPFADRILHETLDIDPNGGATHVADITKPTGLDAGAYDCVVFTEVLEHTSDPFGAIREISRILSPGGILLMSTPLNLRMHGPFPDAWRITEWGYRLALENMSGFEILELRVLESPRRPLFPMHHTAVAQKKKARGEEADEDVCAPPTAKE